MPENEPLKPALTGLEYKIESAEGIITKLKDFSSRANSNSLTETQAIYFDSLGSAIGLYDSELANQFVDADKVLKFTNLLHKYKESLIEILPADQEGFNRKITNMEERLKRGLKENNADKTLTQEKKN
ncbi:MAG: hypothetical protein RCO49_07020 [Rickettsia endosymbiont of Argas persicus]